jgi:hypothetical protein
MSPSRVSIAACLALAALSCTSDEDDSQACLDPSACGPAATIKLDLPPTMTFADIQQSTITLCRNDMCLTGAFATINAPPSQNAGVGLAIASTPDNGKAAGASALLMARANGSFWLQVFWPLDLGATPMDGDVYKVSVINAAGTDVTAFEMPATYDTTYPFGKECPTTCHSVVFDTHTS